MNILYHHRTQGTGAEGVHISQIIKGLRGLGNNVSVVCPSGDDPLKTAGNNPFAKKKGGLKKKILSFVSSHLPQALFECLEMAYNFSAYPKIKNIVEIEKVELIYERYAFFMTAGVRIAKERKTPFIVEVNEIAGHKRVRKQVFVRKARDAEYLIFTQAEAIIVVSSFLKQEIVDLGIDAQKIFVISNGADDVLFDPAKYDRKKQRALYSLGDKDIVFGFIGWFVPWHNLEFFIKVFSKIDNENCKLILVGDGGLKDSLYILTETLNIADKVIFAGAIPYEKIPDMINALDICIIPDSNEYRSPIKMFEYMAMGKPVVAPNYEPIRSVIDDGKDGVIFDPMDKENLVRILNNVVNDEGKRKILGNNAREKILKQHLWKHNAQKVLEIYRKVTAQ